MFNKNQALRYKLLIASIIPLLILTTRVLPATKAEKKEVNFTFRHSFKAIKGTCKEIEIIGLDLEMKDSNLKLKSPFVVKIPAISLATGNTNRDSHMLEVLGYPEIFEIIGKIDTIQLQGSDKAMISGKLTIHGVEKPFQSTASLLIDGDTFSLAGNFDILLNSFNIEAPDLLFMKVKENITIEYKFTFLK